MADILDEIKEDIQHERMANLWKKYGSYIIIIALAIVLGTAGRVWWNHRTATAQKALGEQYYQALRLMQSDDKEKAEAALATLSKTDAPGFNAFASLALAGSLVAKGDIDQGIAAYHTCLETKGMDNTLQELCRVFLVSTLLEHDKGDAKEIPNQLELLVKKGNAWHYTGLQLKGAYALKQGQWQEAYDIFSGLVKDVETPASLQSEAEELANAIKNDHPEVAEGKKETHE